jgi:ankyrin repeat protein
MCSVRVLPTNIALFMMTTADALAAIKNGDLEALTAALDTGTDPNADDGYGTTLLMWSVYYNKLHMVNLLLTRGANVHRKDSIGRTALHWATFKERSDVFPAIFSAARIRAMHFFCSPWGCTPLHNLALRGSAEQIAFALSHPGIDVSGWIHDKYATLNVCAVFQTALQTYGEQEARWQPMRYTWIKVLMLPMQR